MDVRYRSGWFISALAFLSIVPSFGQMDHVRLEAMASWVVVDMPTGYETRLAPALAEHLPGWSGDRWGNLVSRVGSGSPRRLIACGVDRPSYAISQITDDGYLRVHRIGRGSRHPLWDQAFEAQQVRILTTRGPVVGVVARTNGHFAQQHRGENSISTADDLWVDVGVSSAQEVAELGIALLDPVGRHLPPWPIFGAVAGPDVGRRAGCAAVATLASVPDSGTSGETYFVLSSQEELGWVGLSSLIARSEHFDEVTIVAPGQTEAVSERRPSDSLGSFGEILQASGVSRVTWIAPAVLSAGSHMEILRYADAIELLSAAGKALGIPISPSTPWLEAPNPEPLLGGHFDVSLEPVARLLERLVETHGVSGHEWAVRRLVLESLPEWAREKAVVDDIGDVFVEAGPEGPATVFMAHMDEVGYEVESISPEGLVTLRRVGGAVSTAWEGQTALLHFDPAGVPSTRSGKGTDVSARWKRQSLAVTAPPPLPGVFATRDSADERDIRTLHAWFGLSGAELESRGIGPGASVTSYKEGLRLGPTRFVARALDDRAGTTALLLAINDIDPDTLPSRVIFAWSVGEEGGLVGAAALARRFGRNTRRIYSIDTFVSSDTPLESKHFAYAPLGSGPVLRAIENSSVSPDEERIRVFATALQAGIPLQIGLTQGGTDGTRFTFWGAPNQGLSWPGRYSHSPGEVLDLKDLSRLAQLIAALARVP